MSANAARCCTHKSRTGTSVWNERQRKDLEALWRDPSAEGARERLAGDLAAFCDKLGWTPDPEMLTSAEKHGDEYLVTLSAVPSELYLLPWEVIQAGAAGTYLSDYASAQVRYAVPGLEPREILAAPPVPGVLFAWSGAGGAVPHEDQAAAIRAAAEAGGVTFRELAEVDEGSLQAALDAGPPSVLHLLCHGLPGPEGEPPRLRWSASDSPSEITATRLARMLRHHNGTIPSHTGQGARSLIVRTTVDGAQRLLGAWRSKILQVDVGVIVGELIMTKGHASGPF